MRATDIADADYFHKVVDCQWACPAHTPVPEYIRRVSAGDYAGAYMINWKSNVFPGILGRTCDRPCEPACRRGRVEEQPVAICRLKRVAADYKGDVSSQILPKPPATRNGKRVACVGAGPASLTVARDLAPLGYEVIIFDADLRAGGMMRSQIPKFRLPDEVIDEEVAMCSTAASTFVGGRRIDSLKALLGEGYDAIFVGAARRAVATFRSPGARRRRRNSHRHRLAGERLVRPYACHRARVIVLGGGNTAMDCCRTSLRLGGVEVKVVVRSGFAEMKASPWEKEDATHEGVPFLNYHVPKAFLHEDGKLTGMTFEKVEATRDDAGRRVLSPTGEPDVHLECDDVLIAVGQENAFPWIEPDAGVAFGCDGLPRLDRSPFNRACLRCSSAATLRSVLRTSSPQSRMAMRRRSRSTPFAAASIRALRPPPMTNLVSQKMGIHEWSYDNAITLDQSFKVPQTGARWR